MSIYTGNDSVLGIGKENSASFGTQVSPDIYLSFKTATPSPANALINNEAPRGGRSTAAPGIGMFNGGFTIDNYVKLDSIGYLLTGLMGKDTVTASGSAYLHTITLDKLPSYTLALDDKAGIVTYYTGAKFGKGSFSASSGQFLMASLDATHQSAGVVAGSPLSPSYSSSQEVEWAHLNPTLGGYAKVDGVSYNITKFALSVDNSMHETRGSEGGRFLTDLTSMGSKITGSFDIEYSSDSAEDLKSKFYGSNLGPAAGSIQRSSVAVKFAIGDGTSIEFVMGTVTFDKVSEPRSKGSVITQSFSFVASQSVSSTADDLVIKVICSNSTAY